MPSPQAPIAIVRFSRLAAATCTRGVPEVAVCDAIANGSRRRAGRGLVVFRRTGPAGAAHATIAVLARLTRAGCVALRVAFDPAPKKCRKSRDF